MRICTSGFEARTLDDLPEMTFGSWDELISWMRGIDRDWVIRFEGAGEGCDERVHLIRYNDYIE